MTLIQTIRIALLSTIAAAALTPGVHPPTAQAAVEPRYVVHVGSYTAVNETGTDWLGSDEIYGGVAVTDAAGRTVGQLRTQLFTSVDTGDVKIPHSDQNCTPLRKLTYLAGNGAFPDGKAGDRWTCPTTTSPAGALAAPFTVTTAVFEQETCTHGACTHPDYYRSALVARNSYDQALGRSSLQFSAAGLAKDLPLPKGQRSYVTEHRGAGAHYRTAVVVTRVQ